MSAEHAAQPRTGLRITGAERIVVQVPFTERTILWNRLRSEQWGVVEVIRLTTNSPEIVGYGETLPHYTWGRVPDEALAAVRGANPADFLGRDDLGAGLQIAIYDVVGKALGVPMRNLFSRPQVREACPISWWSNDMPPEVLAEEAADALAAGYLSHKFKARPWFDVYEQVEAVSAVTPPYYKLDLDWNQMLLDVGSATPVLQRLDTYERMGIYETPIRQRSLTDYRRLRDKVAHPIADHARMTTSTEALPASLPASIATEAHDGYVVSGGVMSVLEQATVASASNRAFWLQLVGTGITTAYALQLGAVLPGASWPAVTCMNIYADDLLTTPIPVSGGYATVSDEPGLGVTVDESALSALAMQPPYAVGWPELTLSVSWPGDRVRHYTGIDQLWVDAQAGNIPVQEPGARLEIRLDDGSEEFAALKARTAAGPFWATA